MLLGVAHDNGYVPTLDLYKNTQTSAVPISLLKPMNIGREYQGLPFEIVQFDSIFRIEELPNKRPTYAHQAHSMSLRQPAISPVKQNQRASTVDVSRPFYPRPVYLNAYDERVDEVLELPNGRADAKLEQRIRSTAKLCNDFHLKGECRKPAGCGFDHEPPLEGEELLAFALRARKSPCHIGTKCRSWMCTLGHICPNGPNCTRKGTCYFRKLHHVHPEIAREYTE